jgi:hypothetical protein
MAVMGPALGMQLGRKTRPDRWVAARMQRMAGEP